MSRARDVANRTVPSAAVASANIVDGTIVDADINASAAIAATKISGTAITNSLITASKGALITSTGSAVAAQSVGANDTLLVADSTQTNGIKWASLTASQVPTLSSTKVPTADINSQSTSYTLVLADAGKLILMTSGSAQTVTIPPNSSVAFSIGTKIDIIQTGAGQCDIAPGVGVTLNSDSSKRKVNVQYAAVSCVKTGTDTWLLIGALKA